METEQQFRQTLTLEKGEANQRVNVNEQALDALR